MDGGIEMDSLILIIRIIAWPFVVLTVVVLFLFLFKKQIAEATIEDLVFGMRSSS
jgi:hypothetical protein